MCGGSGRLGPPNKNGNMKRVVLSVVAMAAVMLSSCLKNEFEDKSFQSSHLIDSYYPATKATVAADRYNIMVSYSSIVPQNAYHSAEYAAVAGITQSQGNAAKFLQLAQSNGDHYVWNVPYTTTNGDFYVDYRNAALEKGILTIELKSDAAFDEEHPAGTSWMNMMTLMIDSYGDYVGRDLAGTDTRSDKFADTKKSYRLFSSRDLALVGPLFYLIFEKQPTLAIKHNLTLSITFVDSEVQEYPLSVTF